MRRMLSEKEIRRLEANVQWLVDNNGVVKI